MFAYMAADAETWWLNATNIGLGIVVLICLVVVVFGVVQELVERRKKGANLSRELDRDLRELVAHYQADDSIFHDAALGPTMADGGESTGDDRRKHQG